MIAFALAMPLMGHDSNQDIPTRRAALLRAMDGVANGNRSSLKAVYDATNAKLFGVILRLVGDRENAEDILQEVYVKVWHRAGRFDASRASPITWLSTIARNTAIDHLRRSGRRPETATDEMPEIADDAVRVDEMLCTQEDNAALRKCLEELQPDHRRSIRLAFFDGLTHSQLSERMNVPLGTMKSWIRRGLQNLKGCLGG